MGSEKPATIELNRDGEAVTLSWGPHSNTGYRISIVDSFERDQQWYILYTLDFPEDNEAGVLDTVSHPQAFTTVPEEYSVINLVEESDDRYYQHLPTVTVEPDHSFELSFEEPLLEDAISNDLLYVLDEEHELVQNFIFIYTPTEVHIRPPTDSYKDGQLYHLYIDAGIENTSGEHLTKGYKQSFYVQEDDDSANEWLPPNMLETQALQFEGERSSVEDDREGDNMFSIHLSESEDGSYIILQSDEDELEEVMLPPVTTPSSFLPLHPFLPYPHQYGLTQM